jgi:ribosome-associated protein
MESADGTGRADVPLPGGSRIPADEVEELASRSSGPGGQHVNTSSTRVTLRWNLRVSRGLREGARARLLERLRSRLSRDGVLTIHADRHRSRRRNLADAHARLRELVEEALHEAPPRRPTRPTRGARERRLQDKRRRSDVKRQRRPNDPEG